MWRFRAQVGYPHSWASSGCPGILNRRMRYPAAFNEINENLRSLDDWEDRYKYIIELGQALPRLSEREKNPATKVSGCVS